MSLSHSAWLIVFRLLPVGIVDPSVCYFVQTLIFGDNVQPFQEIDMHRVIVPSKILPSLIDR